MLMLFQVIEKQYVPLKTNQNLPSNVFSVMSLSALCVSFLIAGYKIEIINQ